MSQPSGQSSAFFVSGGTLKTNVPSYVERAADREFFERLLAGDFCYVLTSRQMGKSSLMARTAVKLRDAGALTAIVDLTGVGEGGKGSESASTWYFGIARAITRELGLKADLKNWWQGRDGLPEQQRFAEFLEDLVLGVTRQRVVIFVDEIDATLRLPFTDDFFAGIRACYNARASKPVFERLTFALLGVASPSELIKDTSRTPFNIGQRIELTDFTIEEAQPLAAGFPLPPAEAARALERVLHWTGGQPYLTQKLCLELSRRLNGSGRSPHDGPEQPLTPSLSPSGGEGARRAGEGAAQVNERGSETGGSQAEASLSKRVDDLVGELLFSPDGSRDEVHFKYIRDRLRKDPQARRVLLTYRRVLHGERVPDNPQSLLHNALKLAGLVRRGADGGLAVRNPIYPRVFDLNWVKQTLAADPTRRRAFALGVAAILLLGGPVAYWNWAGSEEARTRAVVQALLDARPEKVPQALARLETLQRLAVPELKKEFAQAQPRSVSQLNAALGLAMLGDLSPLQQMTRRDPDPTSRTAFIHGYHQWPSDPLRLEQVLQSTASKPDTNTVLADFRSALCAAFALVEWDTLAASNQVALRKTMQQLCTNAPDGGTHSAAASALTRWGQPLPHLSERTSPPVPGRDWFVNRLGMTMVRIPAGSFRMGDPEDPFTNAPLHSVTLSNAFFISDREVTVAQFRQFTNQAPRERTVPPSERPTDWEGEDLVVSPATNCPVQQVSWYDAVKFCNWLSRQERRTPCYKALNPTNWVCDFRANGYRLPTEAEWEYACRAFSQSRYTFGDDEKLLGEYAWYSANSANRTWPAGSKLPNLWGLFDMHGNVWEWCQDWHDHYLEGSISDPTGPASGNYRVLRGGSWIIISPADLSSSYRYPDHPYVRLVLFGFRCVVGVVGSAPR